jgi:hypothetical protein
LTAKTQRGKAVTKNFDKIMVDKIISFFGRFAEGATIAGSWQVIHDFVGNDFVKNPPS